MLRTLARFANSSTSSTIAPTAGITPTAAAAQLPKTVQGAPWSAPPKDQTVGELGQVFIPDMERIEAVPEQAIQIPGEPDNYKLSSSSASRADQFHTFRSPAVFTVSSPTTHPGGQPSHGSGSDEVTMEGAAGESTARAVPEGQDVSGQGSWVDRKLNAEEKKGAWTLGGIVVGGLLLGGLLEGGKTEKKVREVVGKVEEKAVEQKRLV